MTDPPLTVEQAREAMRQLGIDVDADGRGHCPACDPDGIFTQQGPRLTISQNGAGAHLACANGCGREILETHLRRARPKAAGDMTPEERLDALRGWLECDQLEGLIQRGRENPLFDLRFTDGQLIPLGPMSHLKDPRKVEDAIAEATGQMPPYFTVPKFRNVVNALLKIRVLDDHGQSANDETRSYLDEFARRYARGGRYDPDDSETRTDLARDVAAFWSTRNELWIHVPTWGDHLRTYRRIFIDDRHLVARLRRLNFDDRRLEGKRSTRGQQIPKRTFWHSEPDFDPSDAA